MTPVKVAVMANDEYRAWRGGRLLPDMAAHIAETGVAPIRLAGESFYWTCPACGGTAGGYLAAEPVSGWENPRWVRSGDDEHVTLSPSLGCPGWRTGECIGHWWLRDGLLVLA
ncbi:MAG: hypothetical protein JWM93_2456 [Frankiales bacterium]|nr:hypothetical protein [Frankiales bacterium]